MFFCPNLDNFFFSGNRAVSVFKYSNYPPLCKISEETKHNEQTDEWTGKQTTVTLLDPHSTGSNNLKSKKDKNLRHNSHLAVALLCNINGVLQNHG